MRSTESRHAASWMANEQDVVVFPGNSGRASELPDACTDGRYTHQLLLYHLELEWAGKGAVISVDASQPSQSRVEWCLPQKIHLRDCWSRIFWRVGGSRSSAMWAGRTSVYARQKRVGGEGEKGQAGSWIWSTRDCNFNRTPALSGPLLQNIPEPPRRRSTTHRASAWHRARFRSEVGLLPDWFVRGDTDMPRLAKQRLQSSTRRGASMVLDSETMQDTGSAIKTEPLGART